MYRAIQDTRFPLAVMIGGLVSFAMFLFMHQLIATNRGANISPPVLHPIHTVKLQRETPVITKPHPRPHPPVANKQPKPIDNPAPIHKHVVRTPIQFPLGPGDPDGPVIGNTPNGTPAVAEGSAPIGVKFRVKPLYPPQAAVQGVEGSVETCFTVASDGTVVSPHVIGASSPQARRLLGQAALQTILQWEFFPRKVNGQAVATRNVCQNVLFRLH